jgi:hypothetical protein
VAESNANQALTYAEGNAKVVVATAEQALAGIENTAKVAEAGLEGEVEITRAEAQTQYAGSGLVVNITGINPTDAAAVASEVGWNLRTQLSPVG